MDLLYNLKNAKSSREPISRTTPHYHESENIAETQAETVYNSWLPVPLPLAVFLGRSFWWIFGRTPPCAIVTCPRSLFNSSSLRMASCR